MFTITDGAIMKKTLVKILCLALSVCLLFSVTACNGASWSNPTMKTPGNVVSNGGFVAETDNYIYFINGVATSTDDNDFGAPVKGSLVVADKNDLSKTQIVVPKLFASTDYNQGVFIDNGFVYYGTPNTEKNSSGEVANTELTFMRTGLDGNGSESFFTVSSLATEYRFVKSGNDVHIIYYNTEDTALIDYNTTDKTETVIVKTDVKAEKLSLQNYKFVHTDYTSSAVVLYTVTVYNEEYDSDKAEIEGYERSVENYNRAFSYKVGDQSSEDSSEAKGTEFDLGLNEVTYEIKLVKDNYAYVSATQNTRSKTYAVSVDDLSDVTLIYNESYAASANVIHALDSVYILENGTLYHTTMTESDVAIKKKVAINSAMTTLISVEDADGDQVCDTVYYFTSENKIAKMELRNVKADGSDTDNEGVNEIIITENTAVASWYKPEFMTINGKDYLFYADGSEFGKSYVKYIDLGAEVIEEEKNDVTVYHLDAKAGDFIGKLTEADQAGIVTARINAIELENSALILEEDDNGNYYAPALDKVKAIYDAQTDAVKGLVDATAKETLDAYVKAVEIANKYKKLEGIENYTEDTVDNIPQSLKDAYESVKADIENIKNGANGAKIDGYVPQNLKYFYQQAKKLFNLESK